MTPRGRWTAAAAAGVGVAVAGTVAVAVFHRSEPTLLPADAFPTATRSEQNNAHALAQGATWCTGLSSWHHLSDPIVGSWFGMPDAAVGATIMEGTSDGMAAAELLRAMSQEAARCAEAAAADSEFPTAIDPLVGLPGDAVGWRTRDSAAWGEYVLIPLDADRLLALGFSTTAADPPIALDDLLTLAKQGAEQFPASD